MAPCLVPLVSFKPILRIDPEQRRAAQIARREFSITVKFPPIDLDNLPEWPPLSDDEGEGSEDSNTEEESADEDLDVGNHPSTADNPQPSDGQQARSPSRKSSAFRETTSSVTIFDHVDTFIPSRRRAATHTPRAPRKYFASDPLRTHLPPKHSPDPTERASSTLASPAPNRLSSLNRLDTDVENSPPRNNTMSPVTGTHMNRLGSRVATPYVNSVETSQSGLVRSNSQIDLTAIDDNATVMREANMSPPARSIPSLGPIPEKYPRHSPTNIALAPQAHQTAEGNPSSAMQSTFRMAMALSKPYQPGQHVANYQIVVASGNSVHQCIHLIPDPHFGAHSAEPGNGNDEVKVGSNREPTLQSVSHQEPSVSMNLSVEKTLFSEGVFPSPPGTGVPLSREDISALPLGLACNREADANDGHEPEGRELENTATNRDMEGGDDENRTVSMSPRTRQQRQGKQPQTNVQASRLQEMTAPDVDQQPQQNQTSVIHNAEADAQQHDLTSENIARLQQQKAWLWTGAQPSSSVAPSAASSRSSARKPLHDESRDTRDSLPSGRPPARRLNIRRPVVDGTQNDDVIRQAPEKPAPFKSQRSIGGGPEKRRRIDEEEGDNEGDDGTTTSRRKKFRQGLRPGREGLPPGRERPLPRSFRQFLENQSSENLM